MMEQTGLVPTPLNPMRTYGGTCTVCRTHVTRELPVNVVGDLLVTCESDRHTSGITVLLSLEPSATVEFRGTCPMCGRLVEALVEADVTGSIQVVCRQDHMPAYAKLTPVR